jgi:hypothetical protein
MTLKSKLLQSSLLALALTCAGMAPASAQSVLRIGLAEDPDLLDPTMARTYVGRIVFASICDKLFDIDEKLNFVPQLALSQRLVLERVLQRSPQRACKRLGPHKRVWQLALACLCRWFCNSAPPFFRETCTIGSRPLCCRVRSWQPLRLLWLWLRRSKLAIWPERQN